MSPLHRVGVVARREVTDRLRSRMYVLGTGAILLFVAALVVGPTLFGGDGPTELRLATVGEVDPALLATLHSAAELQDAEVEVVAVEDRAAAEAELEQGEVHAALVDDAESRELLVDGPRSGQLRALVETADQQAQLADRLGELGLAEQDLARLLAGAQPLEATEVGGDDDTGVAGPVVGLMATVLLFIAIQINGTSLFNLAIEEKSNRVVEVMLGTLRPWQLLSGKLAAMTSLALLQIALVVAVALGVNALVGAFEVPAATTATVVSGLVMVVVGFLLYASLYVVAGSMASSIEDANAAAGPLTVLVIVTYVLVVSVVLPSPDGTLARVLSFVPPTAPFTVPARVAAGVMPGWQVVLAVLVTGAGTVAIVRLAGRLYGAAVLSGGKLTWREAWRAEPVR